MSDTQTTERICMNCKFWSPLTGHPIRPELEGKAGECESPKFIYSGSAITPEDGVRYWDAEDYSATMETGPKFGCVLFEAK